MEELNSDEYKKIKLISQGTYGCVFKNGLTCDGMVDQTNTISKIQEKNETSENEVKMGKRIMEIPNYQEHFAPIIESCEVDISKIESAEINKCNFIKSYKNKDQPLTFHMNKIEYVGNKHLSNYFLALLENKQNVEKFSGEFMNIFLEISNKYRILNEEHNIIHMDVKTNNIMINEKKNPIIIDFGLSFDKKELLENKTNLELIFFADEPHYAYWCFDIYVINFAIETILLDPKTNEIKDLPVNLEQLKECTDIYFEKNIGLDKLLTVQEKNTMKQSHFNYLKKLCNLDNETQVNTVMWKQTINKLIENSVTWDMYGLCICYLEFFNNLKLKECEEKVEYLCSFKNIVKTNIMKTPDERGNSIQIIETINEEMHQVSKKEHKKIKTILSGFFKNPINFTERRQTVKASIEKLNESSKNLQNQKDSNRK
jgi:serine/threonine protein kinase